VSEDLLKVDKLNVYYESLHAVHEASFDVRKGEVVALLGANGAGKTSTLHALVGIVQSKGSIIFLGKRIDNLKPYQRIALGLALVPEGGGLFSSLTVLENLVIGSYVSRANREDALERVFSLFPVLKERAQQAANKLSGGEQKMLLIGRALMSNPRLLLLDEVSLVYLL
jgi:branched-chain amino acid transport system ATP-binding protein